MKSKNAGILALLLIVAVGLLALAHFGIGTNQKLSYKDIKQGLDLSGGVYIVYEADKADVTADEMASAVSMIQERLDRKNWTEAEVAKEGTKRIRVEIPGVEDAETAIKEIGQTAQLFFCDEEGQVLVEGSLVKDAKKQLYTGQNQQSQVVVSLEFNDEGKEKFYQATSNNIGKRLAIVLDENVISAPTVNVAISDGKAIIEGGFTTESAEELAALIRAGSLPFNLNVLEMNNIGASLGIDSLKTSLIGGASALAIVLLFMLFIYRILGFTADWALVIYIGLDLIILSALGITLTLPGIAGIVLSMGMAIDANVIIFERIKEELNFGRSLKAAINNGFSRAFPAILDSNITTIIAGVVLFWLGTGPIKGFAQTLIIGIVLSMFTAIVITRLIINGLVGIGIKNPKLFCSNKGRSELDESSAK